MDKKNLFDKNKSTTSYEKAEKVVKDPSKPIIRKYFIKFSDIFLTYPNEIKYPIRKDPIIFINNVGKKALYE